MTEKDFSDALRKTCATLGHGDRARAREWLEEAMALADEAVRIAKVLELQPDRKER